MDAKRKSGNKAPRILLVNLHSSYNAGDNALTCEALRQLKEQFPQASFVLAMNDPQNYQGEGRAVGSFTSWVTQMLPLEQGTTFQWRWKVFPLLIGQSLFAVAGYRLMGRPWFIRVSSRKQALLESYFQADMVISAAGNFLYTSGKVGLPFILSLFSMLYAWLAGKPLYTLPQTLGPIRRRWEQFLAKKTLSRMRLVMVRDPISAEVWKSWGVKRVPCNVLPDLAFAFNAAEGKEETRAVLKDHGILGEHSGPYLGVTMIHWGAQNRLFSQQATYEEAIIAAIRSFIATYGGQAILFAQVQGPTAVEDDRIPARRVFRQLSNLGDRVVLIEEMRSPRVLKTAYAQMDLFIGTRLHSNIFALTEGVPVIAIGYQYKTRGVLRMLGLERWVLDIEQVNRESLVQLLHEVWRERESIRKHLRAILPEIQSQASRAGERIASDYSAFGSHRG